jgi:hypothetical protein
MAGQIARNGRTVTVEIPEDMPRKANLSVGDPVEWTLTPSGDVSLHAPGYADALAVEERYEEWACAEIRRGIAEVDAGNTVSHEKVVDWLRS